MWLRAYEGERSLRSVRGLWQQLGLFVTTFVTMAEVDAYLGGPRVTCLICGVKLKSLARHLRLAHGVDPRTYRIEHGIPLLRALEAKATVDNRSATHNSPEQRAWARQLNERFPHHHTTVMGETRDLAPAVRQKLRGLADARRQPDGRIG